MTDHGSASRRELLRSTAAGSAVGFAALFGNNERGRAGHVSTAAGSSVVIPTSGTVKAEPSTFVERDGTNFVVGGDPVYFTGSSNLGLTQPETGSIEAVGEFFATMSELGFDLVRTSAFGSGTPDRLQPSPGEYNEEAFEYLDQVIAEAGKHDVRLALPLTSGDSEFGGIPQYAAWAGIEESAFYTNEEAQERYRSFVETVLTRQNTVTGVESPGG